MLIKTEDLLRAIVWCANRRGEKLTTLRLVKFVYLADLYYARYAKGETLTGCPWAFVHFGPWCKQVNEAINRAANNGVILAQKNPSQYDDAKDYRVFWVEDTEEPKVVEALPLYVWSKLQWAIHKWGDDSFGLLDYIYFETEPMLDAKPGALLDFRRSQMPPVQKKIQLKRIPNTKLDEAKKNVARLREKFKTGFSSRPSQGPLDTVYQEFISKLEEEDLETGLEGSAELGDLDAGRK
jgi:hypothetical protein